LRRSSFQLKKVAKAVQATEGRSSAAAARRTRQPSPERYLGNAPLEAAQAGQLPDRHLHLTRVTACPELDQESDRTSLHLTQDHEIQAPAGSERLRLDRADLDIGQPGKGLGEVV
jgi:hypothetical protein